MEDKPIIVHNVLNGYDGGHRRVAGSVALPQSAESQVLVLSDMSGSQLVPGYETYLTGYPLPEAEYFALARTWYAPEMPRPGSVWTHTLLIRSVDLGRFQSVRPLVALFRRPNTQMDFSAYDRPIVLDPIPVSGSRHLFPLEMTSQILKAIYEQPKGPVFIVSSKAATYEQLVLELWTQQWDVLRGSFRFCTGSMEDRFEQGVEFDLQVIPQVAIGRVLSRNPTARIVEGDLENQNPSPIADWLHAAAEDLSKGGTPPFRTFLRESAPKVPTPRHLFRPLADTYARAREVRNTRSVESVLSLIETIAKHFPKRLDASSMKRALLGVGIDYSNLFIGEMDEVVLLEALIRTKVGQALDAETLAIKRRAESLWLSNRESASRILDLVRFPPRSEIPVAFGSGVAAVLSISDLPALVNRSSTKALWFISRRPELAADPQLWRMFPKLIHEFLPLLEEEPGLWNVKAIPGLIGIALDADAEGRLATRILRLFGEPAVWAFLDTWLEQGSSRRTIAAGWQEALAEHPENLLQWVKSRGSTDAGWVVAGLVEPDLARKYLGMEPWLHLVSSEPRGIPEAARLNAMSFLFCMGMKAKPGGGGGPLLAFTFEPLHEALANNSASGRAWHMLSSELPQHHPDWDRCARLRQAVVRHFSETEEDLRYMFAAFRAPSTFRHLLKDLAASGGQQTLDRLKDFARRHEDLVTRDQATMLHKSKRSVLDFLWDED